MVLGISAVAVNVTHENIVTQKGLLVNTFLRVFSVVSSFTFFRHMYTLPCVPRNQCA